MSVEPTSPAPPVPPPRRRGLLVLLIVLIVVLLVVLGLNLLGQTLTSSPGATATPPGATATLPGAPATEAIGASPSAGILAPATGLPTAPPTAPGEVAVGATATLPPPQPTAVGRVPATAAATGTAGAGLPGLVVIDSLGEAYACGRVQGCSLPAAPAMGVYAGGEARTGADSRMRLQSPAGLLALDAGTNVRATLVDATQVVLTLTQGRVLARAAAGRTETLAITAGATTVSGAGSSFAVALQPDGSLLVAVPADSAHPAHVHNGSGDADLSPGSQLTVAGSGTLGTPTALDLATAASLATLGGAAGTPTPLIVTTELPVPTPPPLPSGVVTATIVLTPPPEQTLPPLTIVPIGIPSPTGGPSLPISGTLTPGSVATATVALGPSALAQAVVSTMSGTTSYTFGATRGADPASAEFSAGTVAGTTACWTATSGGQVSDYQVRSGIVFRRSPGAAWQQQPDQQGLPAWLTAWQWLGQIDPASLTDLGPQALDAVTVEHLRARLLPAAGQGASAWLDAYVGDPDHLVHSLLVYGSDPASSPAVLKIGYSSFGAPLSCPALNQP